MVSLSAIYSLRTRGSQRLLDSHLPLLLTMTPPARVTMRVEDTLVLDDPDDLSHPNHEQSPLLGSVQIHLPLSGEEEEDHVREVSSWKKLPWWKRPSPYWSVLPYVRAPETAIDTRYIQGSSSAPSSVLLDSQLYLLRRYPCTPPLHAASTGQNMSCITIICLHPH